MNEISFLEESFRRNGRVNQTLLETITLKELDFALQDGEWTIGKHLGHLADFRFGWLSHLAPEHAKTIPEVVEGTQDHFELIAKSIQELAEAFTIGDQASLNAVHEAMREGQGFERAYQSHPAHFLQHIIVHDSHHRGQVITLLRQSGRTAEQLDKLDDHWGIWRE